LINVVVVVLVVALGAGTLAFTVDRVRSALANVGGADPTTLAEATIPAPSEPATAADRTPEASATPLTPSTTEYASPSPSAPPPSPPPTPTPATRPKPFAMDLYRKGDFVGEKTPVWCLPAAMQTSINIMSKGADRTAATQGRLFDLARSLVPAPDGAAEPEGWAQGLNRLGFGHYEVRVYGSVKAAIKAAARALRKTNRPVGLMVWRGAHSWVMSGFTATADPRQFSDFKVNAVRIEDVWWPRYSSIWGYSRPPDVLVPVSKLPEDFLPWRRPQRRYPDKDRRFVVVLPTL